jgi:putative DNA primase/helicase
MTFNLEPHAPALAPYMIPERLKQIGEPKRLVVKYSIKDGILGAEDFVRLNLPSIHKYLDPIVGERRIILLTGWRGVGKTWTGLSIADCITRGLPFGPWPVREPVVCCYLDGEMACQDSQERLLGLNPSGERRAPLFIYSDAHMNAMGLPRASLLNKRWREEMKTILIDLGVKVFFIDNIASLAPGIDENSKQAWDPVNQWLIELRFAGITSILLHHTNKDGGQRGTSAREDNLDMSIILKQPSDYSPESGADFIMSFSKSRVAYDDLKKMQDIRFTLTQEDGHLVWTWREVKGEIRDEVMRMIDQGMDYKDIASALGITKGRISQIRTKATKDGILDSKGRFTGKNIV